MPTTFLAVTIARAQLADSTAMRAARQVGAVAFFTILTIIAAQVSIPLPFTPVPFTFQPMVVLVGAAALGARLGAASQVLYLTLGMLGLPVFAASPILPQGLARLLGPTGGYLMAYPFAAFVCGALAERGFDRRYLSAVATMLAGLALVFAGGVTWLAISVQPAGGFAAALSTGFYPFIVADIGKLLIAAGIMPSLWWLAAPSAPFEHE